MIRVICRLPAPFGRRHYRVTHAVYEGHFDDIAALARRHDFSLPFASASTKYFWAAYYGCSARIAARHLISLHGQAQMRSARRRRGAFERRPTLHDV